MAIKMAEKMEKNPNTDISKEILSELKDDPESRLLNGAKSNYKVETKSNISSTRKDIESQMDKLNKAQKDIEAQMAKIEQVAQSGGPEDFFKTMEDQGFTREDIQQMMSGGGI